MKKIRINKAVIAYLFWGVVTTILNIGIFMLVVKIGINYQVGNVLGWLAAVTVSYFTNKVWVFYSKYMGLKNTIKEMGRFFFYRIVTLVMDFVITFIGISLLGINSFIVKVVDNVVVVVCNYIFSKLLIFKKGNQDL